MEGPGRTSPASPTAPHLQGEGPARPGAPAARRWALLQGGQQGAQAPSFRRRGCKRPRQLQGRVGLGSCQPGAAASRASFLFIRSVRAAAGSEGTSGLLPSFLCRTGALRATTNLHIGAAPAPLAPFLGAGPRVRSDARALGLQSDPEPGFLQISASAHPRFRAAGTAAARSASEAERAGLGGQGPRCGWSRGSSPLRPCPGARRPPNVPATEGCLPRASVCRRCPRCGTPPSRGARR